MSRSKVAKRGALKTAEQVVAEFPVRDLMELFRFWAGKQAPKAPDEDAAIRGAALALIQDAEVIEARVSKLGAKLKAIFERHFAAEGGKQRFVDLA
ncbi:MAG: hypothetical protein MK291_13485, partial [Planctomycetes bacterium]|nr:hypothetical protein [Planctomycetota bacterium]